MPKIVNTSRKFAAHEATQEKLSEIASNEWAWLFITEPVENVQTPLTKFVFNDHIQTLPTLTSKFWDITRKSYIDLIGEGRHELETITFEQAKEVYRFLKTHSDKNILVSCFAGVCRSGAVAQFMQKYFSYEWPEPFRSRANPNPLVYQLLERAWREDIYAS